MRKSAAISPEPVQFVSRGENLCGQYYQVGEADECAVIICHGAFEHRGNWRSLAYRLSNGGFSTLIFDFSGHGESDGLRGLVDMSTWAYNLRDAINLLGRRGLRRFAVVGWDNGGSAALLAAAHDNRIVCVSVLAAPIRMMPSLAERVAYGLLSLVALGWKRILRRQFTLSRLPEFEALTMTVDVESNRRYLADPFVRQALQSAPVPESLHTIWLDITSAVEKISTPVLLVYGEKDRHVPMKQSEILQKHLKGPSQLLLIPDAGHALHFEPGEAVYRELFDWISKYLGS
ncbi:MAG: alpha/beta hydrolase [Proteobacteria bacterium]|nr:alpha/beta hydrolase [Pseudomonadota bacterium]